MVCFLKINTLDSRNKFKVASNPMHSNLWNKQKKSIFVHNALLRVD